MDTNKPNRESVRRDGPKQARTQPTSQSHTRNIAKLKEGTLAARPGHNGMSWGMGLCMGLGLLFIAVAVFQLAW